MLELGSKVRPRVVRGWLLEAEGCTLKRGYLVHYCAVEEVVLLKAGALSLPDKCYCSVLVLNYNPSIFVPL